MYIVRENFLDLETNHKYKLGQIFPFNNKTVEEDRLKELSSTKNKLGKVLISKITSLEELTEVQLLEYIKIIGLDTKKILLDGINKIESIENNSNLKMNKNDEKVAKEQN